MKRLVEKGRVSIVDNTREPFEYSFHWKNKGFRCGLNLASKLKSRSLLTFLFSNIFSFQPFFSFFLPSATILMPNEPFSPMPVCEGSGEVTICYILLQL